MACAKRISKKLSDLKRVVFCVQSQNRDLHLVDLADETGVLIILFHVAITKLAGGEPDHKNSLKNSQLNGHRYKRASIPFLHLQQKF